MKDDMKLEMQAGSNIQLDHIKEIMKENIPDLLAENQRLKVQLDREIHINRIMKKALEKYAKIPNEPIYISTGKEIIKEERKLIPFKVENSVIISQLAQETLKQIEEME